MAQKLASTETPPTRSNCCLKEAKEKKGATKIAVACTHPVRKTTVKQEPFVLLQERKKT